MVNLRKQIDSLNTENKEVEDKLRTRETDLYKYRFKIKDLNKSKQVLTHRTYEMRNNLEPKDMQIQNLKDQYLKLEEVFDAQMKKLSKAESEMHKTRSKITQLNSDLRHQNKQYESKHAQILKFALDVHKIVQTKDDK